MSRLLVFLALAAVAAATAPAALAGVPTRVAAIDLAARADSTPATRSAGGRFTLVGLHWRGSGRLLFRTRSLGGRWSGWRPAAPEAEDRPDVGARENRLGAGWRIGSPWWVGPSDRLETRSVGRVGAVRAHLVWSPGARIPYRRPAMTETPAIVPRVSWSADESIRRAPPSYAPEVRFAVVHHTAGRNDYTRSEAPAIVKAIQLYHVQGNGWNDIGYNFLVDRFGTIYEGRYGGVDRNVIGAHAMGFNTGSVGVALLGTYGNTAPAKAALDAIARLLAWRLDLAHVDPTGFETVLSGGNERFGPGAPVPLRIVSGHRDTGSTECPGDALYARLNALATTSVGIGLPKIFEPLVEQAGSSTRFRARLSGPLAWTVSVADASGLETARGTGTGTEIDWTWDATAAAAGRYSWSIEAGSARPATGPLRVGGALGPLAIEGLSSDHEAISPNGDGQADAATVSYRLSRPANVTITVTDAVGTVISTLVDRVWTGAGAHSVLVDGTTLSDGNYSVVVTARTEEGAQVQDLVPLTVSRVLGVVAATPALFSPNGDGRRDRLAVTFQLMAPADVIVRIVREGRWVATPFTGTLQPGPQHVLWDGSRSDGRLRDGPYSAVVEARDATTTISFAVPFASDVTAPRLRILPGKPLRVAVNEPVTLSLRIDGRVLRRDVGRAGIVRIPWRGPAVRVRAVAWDAAGNSSGPVLRITRP